MTNLSICDVPPAIQDSLRQLHFVRLICRLQAMDPIDFHSFPDSTFRRFFAALTHSPGCPGYERSMRCIPSCTYGRLFGGDSRDDLPEDLRRRPPAAIAVDLDVSPHARLRPGDAFHFGLLMVGQAATLYPLCLHEVYEVGCQGLGPHRSRFALEAVYCTTPAGLEQIYVPGVRLGSAHRCTWEDIRRTAALLTAGSTCVEFVKPARIAVRGSRAKSDYAGGADGGSISFADLIGACCSRVRSLVLAHCADDPMQHNQPLCEWSAAMKKMASDVRTEFDLTVWREQARMDWDSDSASVPMSGLVGEVGFACVPEPLLPVLLAGELLQVGKHTSYGNGRYRLRRASLSS